MKRWYKLAALVAGVATLAGVGATARVADAAPSATALTVATRTGNVQLDWAGIESLESAGNYVEIHLPDGKSFLHRATLKELEVVAKPQGWQRIHRTAIVNPRHVKARVAGDGVRLASGRVLRIGRSHKRAVSRVGVER